MPIYPYKCTKCGKEFDESFSMKDAPNETKCSCGAAATRNWQAYSIGGTPKNGYPHYSSALGVNISQIPMARKYWPGSEFNRRGDILIKSREHRRQIIKLRGMTELD